MSVKLSLVQRTHDQRTRDQTLTTLTGEDKAQRNQIKTNDLLTVLGGAPVLKHSYAARMTGLESRPTCTYKQRKSCTANPHMHVHTDAQQTACH